MKRVMIGTMAAITGAAGAPSPLSRYVDHARVLVISAPTASNPDLRRQSAALSRAAAGLKARDVVVLSAVDQPADAPRGGLAGATALRAAVGLPAGRFGVALVGKDGGVKLSRQAPVSTETLFRTIDAMPMRRDEMRRANPE